ncbi:hypothetical protein PoB_003756300 [Plakobranchus ocellatus]|uniref:Uncharacterized protein n=1 Tax=Plakobranchus ocellatus TaxID=259542 RepID=A0AAV4AW52_9GAST|nr:hypothetical protein PoB_003756300 [Plakobranchus ocellatus]
MRAKCQVPLLRFDPKVFSFLLYFDPSPEHVPHPNRGIGGSVASESALKSAGIPSVAGLSPTTGALV